MHAAESRAQRRILLVEDDPEIARMSSEMLAENGFGVSAVGSARDMDAALRRENVDVIVLDVRLPDEDGFSICRRLRAASAIPIVMVTACSHDADRIVGLEMGADDYLVKPFNMRELVARIRALLRRTRHGTGGARASVLRFAGWSLDPVARLLRDPLGVRVAMTSIEIDLLIAFCRNAGRILTREELLELVHGGMVGSIERSIDVHVSRIRRKIEPDHRDPTFIKTVRLGGYVFTAAVESL